MPLMSYTHPHFDRALLNFRLFLKLGASSRGPTGNLPPLGNLTPSAALNTIIALILHVKIF